MSVDFIVIVKLVKIDVLLRFRTTGLSKLTIKSMRLYSNVERIYNELTELGKSADDPVSVEELSRFDQLHYHGTEALDVAVSMLGLQPNHQVLEVGSGIGGPARYLAAYSSVTALELQADQNQLAQELSERCGLSGNPQHVGGDFLDYDFAARQYDAIVSWLALYHIPDRERMLERCHQLLKPGGQFYIEDLYMRKAFNQDERQNLAEELYAVTLPDWDDYQSQIEANGFEIIHCEELSDDWGAFTHQRLKDYNNDRDRHVRVHGETTVDALNIFYSSVDRHFQSGKLGGIRLLARKC